MASTVDDQERRGGYICGTCIHFETDKPNDINLVPDGRDRCASPNVMPGIFNPVSSWCSDYELDESRVIRDG